MSPGPPHHIELKSQAFDSPDKSQTHSTKVLVNCLFGSPVYAFVCDKHGNRTSLKTTLNLSWAPGSAGQAVSKKTSARGEALFAADGIKCNTPRPDQEVRIKVSSTEHRTLQVTSSESAANWPLAKRAGSWVEISLLPRVFRARFKFSLSGPRPRAPAPTKPLRRREG